MVGDLRIEVGSFMLANLKILFFEKLARLSNKFLSPLFIFVVGLRKPPVSHRAIWIMRQNRPERSLCLVVIKSMKLAQSLIKVSLPFIPA